jgi:hypothetical protein
MKANVAWLFAAQCFVASAMDIELMSANPKSYRAIVEAADDDSFPLLLSCFSPVNGVVLQEKTSDDNATWGWKASVPGHEDTEPFDHPVAAALKAQSWIMFNRQKPPATPEVPPEPVMDPLFHPSTGSPDMAAMGSWSVDLAEKRDLTCFSPRSKKFVSAVHVATTNGGTVEDTTVTTPPSGLGTEETGLAEGGQQQQHFWRFYDRGTLAEFLGIPKRSSGGHDEGGGGGGRGGEGKDSDAPRLASWLEAGLGASHVRRGKEAVEVGQRKRGFGNVVGLQKKQRDYLELSAPAILFFYAGLHRTLGAAGGPTYGLATTTTLSPKKGGFWWQQKQQQAQAGKAGFVEKGEEEDQRLLAATEEQLQSMTAQMVALLPERGLAYSALSGLLFNRLAVVSKLTLPLFGNNDMGGYGGSGGGGGGRRGGQRIVGYVPELPPGTEDTLAPYGGGRGGNGAAAAPSSSGAPLMAREAWVAKASFTMPAKVDEQQELVRVSKGQDVQTAAARFCRKHGIYQHPKAITAEECWQLVPLLFERLIAVNELTDLEGDDEDNGNDDDVAAAPTAAAVVVQPLATFASPTKGSEVAVDEVVSIEVAVRQGSGGAGFCCLYLNNAQASSWCGPVTAPSTLLGGMSLASTNNVVGPHVLQLVCRHTRSDLEAFLAASEDSVLVPDDAAFFAFVAPP